MGHILSTFIILGLTLSIVSAKSNKLLTSRQKWHCPNGKHKLCCIDSLEGVAYGCSDQPLADGSCPEERKRVCCITEVLNCLPTQRIIPEECRGTTRVTSFVVGDLQLDERQTEMFQSFLAVGCDGDARVPHGGSDFGFGQSFMGDTNYAQDW